MMDDSRDADMQQITTRERTLLRVGVGVVILIALWAFGLLRFDPAVVYWASRTETITRPR